MSYSNKFEIDGIEFICDIRPGKDRGKSTDRRFILVKTPAFLNFYKSLAGNAPRNILELGMFEGGSLVLFDKYFRPKRLVGIDIRKEPIAPLETYRKDNEHVRTYYGLSQDDKELSSILGKEFPDGIDLIVDDASHHYMPTRSTFHLCFPFLNAGGIYVVEDWAWSHQPAAQNLNHGWHDKPALTNLVTEFIINLPVSTQISRVVVTREMAIVYKARNATGSLDLSDGQKHLRDRQLKLI